MAHTFTLPELFGDSWYDLRISEPATRRSDMYEGLLGPAYTANNVTTLTLGPDDYSGGRSPVLNERFFLVRKRGYEDVADNLGALFVHAMVFEVAPDNMFYDLKPDVERVVKALLHDNYLVTPLYAKDRSDGDATLFTLEGRGSRTRCTYGRKSTELYGRSMIDVFIGGTRVAWSSMVDCRRRENEALTAFYVLKADGREPKPGLLAHNVDLVCAEDAAAAALRGDF